jgi:hypothetical protein
LTKSGFAVFFNENIRSFGARCLRRISILTLFVRNIMAEISLKVVVAEGAFLA